MFICKYCNSEYTKTNTSQYPKVYCSYSCYETWMRFNREPNCKCEVCGIDMYMKPYRLKRVKNGITCSKKCANILKEDYSKGELNHQYGLNGHLNNSFKGEEITKDNNSIVDIYVYKPDRPDANKNGRITKHRLLVCENYEKYDSIFFNIIDDYYILKDGIEVHHIDNNHDNNDLDNLIPLTKSQHISVHNNLKVISEQNMKLISGVLKQGELLENLEVDNQQPSLSSNTFEGSETNNRVLPDNSADSNIDTSALLIDLKKINDDYIVQTKNITKIGYENSIKEILESEIKSSEIIQNGI